MTYMQECHCEKEKNDKFRKYKTKQKNNFQFHKITK